MAFTLFNADAQQTAIQEQKMPVIVGSKIYKV